MPTSRENRKPEGQETRGPQTDGRTPVRHDGPGRLNEMAAGGMGCLYRRTSPHVRAGW